MIKKLKHFTIPVAALLLASLALAAQDGFAVKRVPKEGDKVSYKMSADIELMGSPIAFSAKVSEKVIKVESNGDYVVESTQTDGKVSFNGQEMEIPSEGAVTTKFSGRSDILELKGPTADSSGYRLANLNNVIAPEKAVKVGDKWSAEYKKDGKAGVAAKADYELVAEEKIGARETLKVKMNYRETEGAEPASSEGTLWLDKADGNLVKMEMSWKNAPIPGAPGPISGKFTLIRED